MNIDIKENGLKCDNPTCEYKDETVELSVDLVGKPCPLCGDNLLTEEDYNNVVFAKEFINFVNTLSPEELDEITKNVTIEDLKESPVFKDAIGLDNLDEQGKYNVTLDLHKNITITEIKKVEDNE